MLSGFGDAVPFASFQFSEAGQDCPLDDRSGLLGAILQSDLVQRNVCAAGSTMVGRVFPDPPDTLASFSATFWTGDFNVLLREVRHCLLTVTRYS